MAILKCLTGHLIIIYLCLLIKTDVHSIWSSFVESQSTGKCPTANVFVDWIGIQGESVTEQEHLLLQYRRIFSLKWPQFPGYKIIGLFTNVEENESSLLLHMVSI